MNISGTKVTVTREPVDVEVDEGTIIDTVIGLALVKFGMEYGEYVENDPRRGQRVRRQVDEAQTQDIRDATPQQVEAYRVIAAFKALFER